MKWNSIHLEEGRKKYKSLTNRLCRVTDTARENGRMNSAQLEKHERQGKMDFFSRKVTHLANRKRKGSLCVCDKEGNVLTDSDMVQDRWKEYTED